MNIDKKYIVGFLGAITLVLMLGFVSRSPNNVGASIVAGQGYNSTTTPTAAVGSHGSAGVFMLSSTSDATVVTSGQYGGISITGTSSGAITVYDATTTDITKRTGGTSTSTITLTSYPAGLPNGDYPCDCIYSKGLIVVFTGAVGSTTPRWRKD